MKTTFKALTRHVAIGALVIFAIFWAIGELSYFSAISDRVWIWLVIPVILILAIWWTTQSIYNHVVIKRKNSYFVSVIFIVGIWLLLFLATAILEGINASIKSEKLEIFDYLEGFATYRLWVFFGFGIIHALIGGIFLAMGPEKIT